MRRVFHASLAAAGCVVCVLVLLWAAGVQTSDHPIDSCRWDADVPPMSDAWVEGLSLWPPGLVCRAITPAGGEVDGHVSLVGLSGR